jgi:pimeloyl-ACP methyl ester carboxylesterase
VPAESRTVATRYGETFVICCGPEDAPPVVLLHGAGTNSTILLADAEQWSHEPRVYLVDIIGEPGLSAGSRPSLQSDAYAAWLDDLLDGLGVERAAFVGSSRAAGWHWTVRSGGPIVSSGSPCALPAVSAVKSREWL